MRSRAYSSIITQNKQKRNNHRSALNGEKAPIRGFTIVELLVVIVVIAILAAISIVSYNGITGRTREVALKSDLKNGATQLQVIQLDTGLYPANADNLKKSEGTEFTYSHTSTTFCLAATNPALNGVSFRVTEDGEIQIGECSAVDDDVEAPVIATSSLPAGVRSVAYSVTVTATGEGPITYAASGLPSGLTINTTTGVISGTPTVSGASNVTLTATNPGGVATRTLTLAVTIMSAPTYASGTYSGDFHPCSPGYPVYSRSFAANTGSNVTYSILSGALPAGVTLNSSTGIVSGTVPSVNATYTFVVQAQNNGGSATVSSTLVLYKTLCPV